MASRPETNDFRCLFFEWAATNYPGVTYTEANEVRHTADFVGAHPDAFNPLWTRERARAEEQKWHADLAVAEVVERTNAHTIQWSTTRHYRYSGSTAALASSRCKLERRCTRKVLPCTIASLTTGRTWSMVRASTRSLRTTAVSRRWNSLVGRHITKGQSVLGNTVSERPDLRRDPLRVCQVSQARRSRFARPLGTARGVHSPDKGRDGGARGERI